MALMIIAMLFIGAGMVASVSERHEWLIHLHKPLGVAILLLVIVRLACVFHPTAAAAGGSAGLASDGGQGVPCCCTP
jgi:cytochrome b561